MKKLLLVIMFLIPCSICSFCFKRKATFFIDKNISKNTKIVYLYVFYTKDLKTSLFKLLMERLVQVQVVRFQVL